MATQERWEADTRSAVSHIIKRPRLTKILDESEARIILLCAPAGYGKTTLAREWVATRTEPVLWYSGGPAMADVAALAVDLAELFGGPESELVEKVRFLAAQGEAPTVLARSVQRTLRRNGAGFVVLDDCHRIAEGSDAETFLEQLVSTGAWRFVITTRRRPAWIDPRSLVYGFATVLSADDLALTPDEAGAIVPGREDMHRIAHGWPALIGLAAVRGAEAVSLHTAPNELFEFFASDLLAGVSEELRRSLVKLAAAGEAPWNLASELLGEGADAIRAAAEEHGFLHPQSDSRTVMHPLLRRFLMRRFAEDAARELEEIVREVQQVLVAHERWGECLDLLEEFPDLELAVDVFERCVGDLLDSGRTETTRRWIQFARKHGLQKPVFVLAEAEVALRAGEPETARSLAKHGSPQLRGELRARAKLIVARSAHLGGHPEDVVPYAFEAASLTTDELLKRDALWLAFLATYEQQDPEAAEHLERLRSLEIEDVDFALRLECAGGVLRYELGHLDEALAAAREARPLFDRARDPFARTNYLNFLAHSLVNTAEYDEAIATSNLQMDEGSQTGLDFVEGYALVTRAFAEIGTRRLREARRTLARLRHMSPKPAAHVVANLYIAESKLAIANGDLDRAAVALDRDPGSVARGSAGEYVAYRGLVLASSGQLASAQAALAEALSLSNYVDAVAACEIGQAIFLAQTARDASAIHDLVWRVIGMAHHDMLITGCRAYPPLARICANEPKLRRHMAELLTVSRDADLARSAGIDVRKARTKGGSLSTREREILNLLSHGRTNRQIAETLFISESTAKVHVRHIFEKLGVHTRAEAVAWLTRLD